MNDVGCILHSIMVFTLGAVKLKTSLVHRPAYHFAAVDPNSLSKPSFAGKGGHTGQLLALEQLQAGTAAC